MTVLIAVTLLLLLEGNPGILTGIHPVSRNNTNIHGIRISSCVYWGPTVFQASAKLFLYMPCICTHTHTHTHTQPFTDEEAEARHILVIHWRPHSWLGWNPGFKSRTILLQGWTPFTPPYNPLVWINRYFSVWRIKNSRRGAQYALQVGWWKQDFPGGRIPKRQKWGCGTTSKSENRGVWVWVWGEPWCDQVQGSLI